MNSFKLALALSKAEPLTIDEGQKKLRSVSNAEMAKLNKTILDVYSDEDFEENQKTVKDFEDLQ